MKLAVLGAGHGGFATAADLALAGHHVRLWSRSPDALGPLVERATITLEAEGRHGTARLERATTDLAEAVEGAEILIAPLPATSHEDLARRLAPYLNDRQLVLLTPGTLVAPLASMMISPCFDSSTVPLSHSVLGTNPICTNTPASSTECSIPLARIFLN